MLKRIIGTSSVFIGSIVGAGFATGKEICVYFGESSIAVPIISAIFMGLFCVIFLLLGRKSDDVIVTIFGRYSYAVRAVVIISNFVIFAAMIAGAELIFRDCFDIKGIGVISSILSIFFIGKGGKMLSLVNTILVPVIIGVLIYFTVENNMFSFGGDFRIISPIAYATMNLLTGGYLVAGYAKKASKTECLLTALLVTVVSMILLVAVYLVAKNHAQCPMPLFEYSKVIGAKVLAGIMIFAAIFTTMTASLKVVSSGCYSVAIVATSIALVVSMIGFQNIVTYAYPVIGYCGIGFTMCGIAALLFQPLFNKRNASIHQAGEHRKCESCSHNKVEIENL